MFRVCLTHCKCQVVKLYVFKKLMKLFDSQDKYVTYKKYEPFRSDDL